MTYHVYPRISRPTTIPRFLPLPLQLLHPSSAICARDRLPRSRYPPSPIPADYAVGRRDRSPDNSVADSFLFLGVVDSYDGTGGSLFVMAGVCGVFGDWDGYVGSDLYGYFQGTEHWTAEKGFIEEGSLGEGGCSQSGAKLSTTGTGERFNDRMTSWDIWVYIHGASQI